MQLIIDKLSLTHKLKHQTIKKKKDHNNDCLEKKQVSQHLVF